MKIALIFELFFPLKNETLRSTPRLFRDVLLGRYSSGGLDGRVTSWRDDSRGHFSCRSGDLSYGSVRNLGKGHRCRTHPISEVRPHKARLKHVFLKRRCSKISLILCIIVVSIRRRTRGILFGQCSLALGCTAPRTLPSIKQWCNDTSR